MVSVGAGLPASTGAAGAMYRVAFFAGEPAPTCIALAPKVVCFCARTAETKKASTCVPAFLNNAGWLPTNLRHHRSQRLRRVGSLADRATDYQVIRTRIQRLARSEDTALVILRTARRANARGHQLQ